MNKVDESGPEPHMEAVDEDVLEPNKVLLIQVQEKYVTPVRYDKLYWGGSNNLSSLVGLGDFFDKITRNQAYLMLLMNFVGNVGILLSLSEVIHRRALLPLVTISWPLVIIVLANANLFVLGIIIKSFEFWFLTFQMFLYCVAMVDVFKYDERISAVILWFFGFMCFNTIDACYRPRDKSDPGKIIACMYSFILWASFIAMGLTGKFTDLSDRTITISVSENINPSIHTVVFASQRLFTCLLFVGKNMVGSILHPDRFVQIRASLVCKEFSTEEEANIAVRTKMKNRLSQLPGIETISGLKSISSLKTSQVLPGGPSS